MKDGGAGIGSTPCQRGIIANATRTAEARIRGEGKPADNPWTGRSGWIGYGTTQAPMPINFRGSPSRTVMPR